MTEKIDTQGMSGPSIPGCSDNIYPHDENGEPILPSAIITPRRLHTLEMVKELKILINEVLDEREGKSGISYFDTEHFKHSVDEEEPPYKKWSQMGYKWENDEWVPTPVTPYRLDELQE